jgi:hypothetical protein|tara:strand:+ start:1021 stop:1215 length:195 start_codon:yes stop_codon:yes gene_type:complete
MWIAKPNLNNSLFSKEFATAKEGAEYLEAYTGIEMAYDRNRKTKEIVYDWELIGKLFKKSEKSA